MWGRRAGEAAGVCMYVCLSVGGGWEGGSGRSRLDGATADCGDRPTDHVGPPGAASSTPCPAPYATILSHLQ